MKYSAILLACMATLITLAMNTGARASEEKPIGLQDLRWKYRVILIFAREPYIYNALSNLDEFKADIEERDIAWFVLGDNTLHTNYKGKLDSQLREELMDSYFTPVPTETAVRLIGKDGMLKSRSADLDLEATFGLIDQMPMRRAEMRRKSEGLD